MAKRKRKSSRRTPRTIAKRRTCKSYRVKCAGKTYQCHPGRKHRKGMFCRLVKGKKRK